MPEARQPLDEQLGRPKAGDEAPPAHAPPTGPDSSPGAPAPGGDGRAAADAATAAPGEDSGGPDRSAPEGGGPDSGRPERGGPDADESALQGDVDELVAV